MKFNSTYVIAEAGVNHNGSIDKAVELVKAAAAAGADAVKFQTFKADKIVSRSAPKADYQTKTTDAAQSQFEMIKKLELNEEAHKILAQQCIKDKIQFLSTPFDIESIDLLITKINIPILKIPSGEITNAPLLLKAAHTGKPIILSTGMSSLEEVKMALGVLAFGYLKIGEKPSGSLFESAFYSGDGQKVLKEKVILLHCTSEYPAPYEEVNLKAMNSLHKYFDLPVGLSDHTQGIAIPIAAVARGAVVVEKHFTLDRNLPGPDHLASLEPAELKTMVHFIRQVESALGTPVKAPTSNELKNRPVVRKSLMAAKDIKMGDAFSEENLTIKRPGTGISPMDYWAWLGRKANRDYKPDEMLEE